MRRQKLTNRAEHDQGSYKSHLDGYPQDGRHSSIQSDPVTDNRVIAVRAVTIVEKMSERLTKLTTIE